MARIEIDDHFYEDEVREGFYIPSAIKQAWGAQIQVLNEIDRVCELLGINYYACLGTLLGAVRHSGFIPWDDDLDICMLRDDYIRFISEGVSLLPKGYAIYNFRTRENHTSFNTNVVANTRICFEPEHLEQFHGFPYIAAVDIFILDYISDNESEQELMRIKAQYIIKISDEIRSGNLTEQERRKQFDFLEKKLGIHIPDNLNDNKLCQFLDICADDMFASFVGKKDRAKQIVYMMPFGLANERAIPTIYYSRQVELPFETGTIPVPVVYNGSLRSLYHDFMPIYKGTAAHDYPFFLKSRKQLQDVLDFELPEYKVNEEDIIKQHNDRQSGLIKKSNLISYKTTVYECLNEMSKIQSCLDQTSDPDTTYNLCAKLQQLAIDLGSYMEAVKGEGYDIVIHLEEYCEALYKLSLKHSTDEADVDFNYILALFCKISEKIKVRKEVAFFPFKGEYWISFESEYKKHSLDPDTDVFIVPIPYFYKDYLGRLRDMQYDLNKYPAELELTGYKSYNIELHHPDIIYIQNPYDAFNPITSVSSEFYSDKLLEYTDCLTYIPWFRTDDFTKDNGPEYINMNYYCTVPGVINADRVILQSDTLKNVYIDKLCEFAGEKTRKLWENKLTVADTDQSKNMSASLNICNDTDNIKTLLYNPDFSEILEHEQLAIDKINNVFQIFKKSRKWRFVILKGDLIDSVLQNINPELYSIFTSILEDISKNPRVTLINEKDTDYETLIEICDAYYGDGGLLAHRFRNRGKPVKLQDYNNCDLCDIDAIFEYADYNKGSS